jgi:phage shock protein C
VKRRQRPQRTEQFNPSRLYRNREYRLLGGVCAGIADFFGISRHAVRLLVAVSMVMFTLPTVIGYFVALVLLKYKPDAVSQEPETTDFWQSVHRSPTETMETIRYRFAKMERRMRNLEAYLTSRKYKLDRAFEKLQD